MGYIHRPGMMGDSHGAADPLSLREVFREHAPFVMRVLARHGIRGADADDLCQEVFLVVHRKLAEFEGRSTLRTWLYGITTRVVSSHRRSARVRREVVGTEQATLVASDDPDRTVTARQELSLLDAGLAALTPDKREAFALYELEQLTMREIAEALGCPEKTVLSRIHSARAALRAFVARRQSLAQARPVRRVEGGER